MKHITELLPPEEIERLYQAEAGLFRQRIPKSLALHTRGKAVMPNGVPMTWMVGLYDHPPIFMERGEGAYQVDVDGNRYLDMNHADMSMSCGYGHEQIVAAVAVQVSKGSQFLLPTELAIEVSELLGTRFGLPKWQYTLSASLANKECIKIAQAHTGRDRVLVFDGSYHGHIPESLDARPFNEAHNCPPESVTIPYNDLDVLEQMLCTREFALVLLEPAMTNISLVKPDPGFLTGVRELCDRYGTLLLIDETHTHVCAYGGLTREWNIAADFRLNRYQRLFMANRGIWEAVLTAGPVVSFVMTKKDVDLYLDVFEQMVRSIMRHSS